MNRAYQTFSEGFSFLMPMWLFFRKARGKEDPARIRERYGITSIPRPAGTLLWLNAASVGEANSVLLLIGRIRERWPQMHILLTTGTVTSARLMQKRLPKGAIHQYVPLDTPEATSRFMHHWRPDIALWVESEFWPNLIEAADRWECFMGVINGRMSERSFAFWRKYPAMITNMLARFDCIFAQSENDAARLRSLGGKDVMCLGNLKFDAALLSCNESELLQLKNAIGTRPVWLAASTHPGEEELIARAHALLATSRPNLLTIIVPRHPERGNEIASKLGKNVALRSRGDSLTSATAFYIADTLGELGLFYRVSEIVFMGGSLVPRGGQNPLEPARLSCAVITGPHTHNFEDIYHDMETARACLRARNGGEMAAHVDMLLTHATARSAIQDKARLWVETQSGAAERLLRIFEPLFTLKAKKP